MKFIYKFSLISLSLLFAVCDIVAQDHHSHHHQRNEIGINTGVLYALGDKEWGSGVHLHYFRTLGDHSRWSIGAFAEHTIFLDNHFSIGVGAKFRLFDHLYLSALPGATFTKHNHDDHNDHNHEEHLHQNDKTKAKFSVHTELVYSLFEWDKFHMGPAIDYSWSKGDSHFMIGVHAAVDF